MFPTHETLQWMALVFTALCFAFIIGCVVSAIKELRLIHSLHAALWLQLRQQGIDLNNIQDLVRRIRQGGA